MANAIQKTDKPGTIVLKTERAADMRLVLQEEKEIRVLVREFIAEQMVKAVDYGPMPGVFVKDGEPPKNVLFKPGAEKLFDIFRCKPLYRVLDKTVDPASGLYYYEIRCRAVNRETGVVLNEGMGSASSYESRYRYRNADRLCPKCKKPAITKSKFPPRDDPHAEPGWYCFGKKGGCGAQFSADDPTIVGQEAGKIQNPDLADVCNTVLKIAKKRAQVDCAIGLARVSDLFTADLEDLPSIEIAGERAPEKAAPRAAARTVPVDAVQRKAQTIVDQVEAAQPPLPQKHDPRLVYRRLTAGRSKETYAAIVEKAIGRVPAKFDLTQDELGSLVAALDAEEAGPDDVPDAPQHDTSPVPF